MKKTLFRIFSFLLSFSLLSIPTAGISEDMVISPNPGTHIAFVSIVSGNNNAIRECIEPLFSSALFPYNLDNNTSFSSYSLGVQKKNSFIDQKSTKYNEYLLDGNKAISFVHKGLLLSSDVIDYGLAFEDLQRKILLDAPEGKALEVWVLYDKSFIANTFDQSVGSFSFFHNLISNNVKLKFIFLSSAQLQPCFSYPEVLKLLYPEADICWYSVSLGAEESVQAVANVFVQQHFTTYEEVTQEVFTCSEQNDIGCQGILNISQENSYLLFYPASTEEFSLSAYIPAPETITEEAPSTVDNATDAENAQPASAEAPLEENVVEEASQNPTEKADSGTAEDASEETVSENTSAEASAIFFTPEPFIPPEYTYFTAKNGSWVSIPSCAPNEYLISFSGNKLPPDKSVRVFCIPKTNEQLVLFNDVPLQDPTRVLNLHRLDNLFTVIPSIKLPAGSIWNVRVLLDNKPIQLFQSKTREDGSLAFEVTSDFLSSNSKLQFQLWLSPDYSFSAGDQSTLSKASVFISSSPENCLYYECSPVYSVTITNQVPSPVHAQVNSPELRFESDKNSSQKKAICIDLCELVSDADKDALAFEFIDENGNSTQYIETPDYIAVLKDTELHYTPLNNSLSVPLRILVNDHDSVKAASSEPLVFEAKDKISFDFIVNQFDVTKELATLSFVPSIPENILCDSADYDMKGSPALALSFSLICRDKDKLNSLAAYYCQGSDYTSNEFLALFSADVTYLSVTKSDTSEEIPLTCSIQSNENGIFIPVEIPAFLKAADCDISYLISFRGEPLPLASDSLAAQITNTAPVVVLAEAEKIKVEMQGKPGKRIPLLLSDIIANNNDEFASPILCTDQELLDIDPVFSDLETPDSLSYEISITSENGKQQVFIPDGSVLKESTEATGFYNLDNSVLNIQFDEIGEYTISIRAFDGEFYSENSWELTIKISSAYTKLLLCIGACCLILLLAFVAIMIIIQHNKPAFKNAYLSIVTSEDVYESNAFCLDPFKKNSVNLLRLIIASGKPPVPGIPTEALKDISIYPQKGEKVKTVIGKTAANYVCVKGQSSKKAIISYEPIFICVSNNENKGLKLKLIQDFSTFT